MKGYTMNKEIEALDLAIAQLHKQKEEALRKVQQEKENKKEAAKRKVTAKDRSLVKQLAKAAKWWREKGPKFKKKITITIKANALWTKDRSPYIDGYDITYNGQDFDFDELIRNSLFKKELEKSQNEINRICDLADALEKKYPQTDLNIFT